MGASLRVIIRSAIKTAPLLDQLALSEVTAALCLCLFTDKRQKHPISFLLPCFHLAGEEHGRSVVRRSCITSKSARSGKATTNYSVGRMGLCDLWEHLWYCYLGRISHFHKNIFAQKSGTCHHLPNFLNRELLWAISKWIITFCLQIYFLYAHIFLLKDHSNHFQEKTAHFFVLSCFCFTF